MKIILFILTINFSLMAQVRNDSTLSKLEREITRGIDLIYNIKFDSAEVIFKSIMAEYPENPAGRFFLAMVEWWRILLDINDESRDQHFYEMLEDVIYHCDQILKQNKQDVNAIFFKGGSIGFRGRLRAYRDSWIKAADDGREALPLVRLAHSIDPNNKDVYLGLGIYNYYAAVVPDRFPYLKPLMIFFPSGDKVKGIEQLEQTWKEGKYASTEALYFLMTLYYQFEENFSKSLEYANELMKKYPDNPIFHRYLGRIYVRMGNYEKASEIFKDVYKKAELKFSGYNKNAQREAQYYIGMHYKLIGQLDSSAIAFKNCVELSKELDKKGDESGFQASAALNLGSVYKDMDKIEKAIEMFNYTLSIKDWNNTHETAEKYLKKISKVEK